MNELLSLGIHLPTNLTIIKNNHHHHLLHNPTLHTHHIALTPPPPRAHVRGGLDLGLGGVLVFVFVFVVVVVLGARVRWFLDILGPARTRYFLRMSLSLSLNLKLTPHLDSGGR